MLAQEYQLPENEVAQEALLAALQIIFLPGSKALRLKASRLVLQHTKPKPNKKTPDYSEAEQWLVKLAEAEGTDAQPDYTS